MVPATVRNRDASATARAALFWRAGGDFPIHRRHVARFERLCRTVAHRARSARRPHSFRKTLATLIDDEGLSVRIGADHLGHSHVSMTQDRYTNALPGGRPPGPNGAHGRR
ncbi:tyrosine-type recombinase/integrase [Mycobacterium sp. 141]|uniref:tyrosine-type recombinase/integrase n=1 Tax=Mycobacterium sp. 141 TaxID=1120797 RepID=UPI0018CA4B8B